MMHGETVICSYYKHMYTSVHINTQTATVVLDNVYVV